VTFDFHGIELILHAAGAVQVPSQRALIIADTHFGKSATFRAKGLPVPEGDTAIDLARLDALLAKTQAERLIIAGDFMHAQEAKTPAVLDLLGDWIKNLTVDLILIQGNHDQRVGILPPDWGHRWVEDHWLEQLHILHDPKDALQATPTLAGHLHPVIAVKQTKGRPLRLRCFWQSGNLLVLPAFGSFTGGHLVEADLQDHLYGLANDQVVVLPKDRYRRRSL